VWPGRKPRLADWKVADDVNRKVEKRLADFDRLKTLIETNDDPNHPLRDRLGS
jgi:hypothetical protein